MTQQLYKSGNPTIRGNGYSKQNIQLQIHSVNQGPPVAQLRPNCKANLPCCKCREKGHFTRDFQYKVILLLSKFNLLYLLTLSDKFYCPKYCRSMANCYGTAKQSKPWY